MIQRQETLDDSHRKEDLPLETPSDGTRECLDACLETARQLIDVLKEEALLLKAFKGHDLLQLLSRKEFLVIQFSGQMERLKGLLPPDNAPDPATRSDRLVLKTHVKEMRRLNEANRSFVHGALGYWQDLLSFCLSSHASTAYSPTHLKPASPLAPKGWTVSKEI